MKDVSDLETSSDGETMATMTTAAEATEMTDLLPVLGASGLLWILPHWLRGLLYLLLLRTVRNQKL